MRLASFFFLFCKNNGKINTFVLALIRFCTCLGEEAKVYSKFWQRFSGRRGALSLSGSRGSLDVTKSLHVARLMFSKLNSETPAVSPYRGTYRWRRLCDPHRHSQPGAPCVWKPRCHRAEGPSGPPRLPVPADRSCWLPDRWHRQPVKQIPSLPTS